MQNHFRYVIIIMEVILLQKRNNDESLIGKKYGRLTIVGFEKKPAKMRGWNWIVECDCGVKKAVSPSDVKSGKVKSCGCLLRETTSKRMKKFEHSIYDNKRLYGIYNGIKKRCYNQAEQRYKDYGGRGIQMCEEWLDFKKGFDNFVKWSLENGYSEELTIDRINVNGDYCPNNCRWITRSEQNGNTRNTRWVEYKGEHIQLFKLCEQLGVSYDTVHDRIYDKGWSVEKALETPSMQLNSLMKKCKEKGLNYGTVRDRIIRFGWSEEEALNTPSIGRGANVNTYGRKKIETGICAVCGQKFERKSVRQKYCGASCRIESKRKLHKDNI